MASAKKEIKSLMKSATPEQRAFAKKATKAITEQARAGKLAVLRQMGIATPPTATEAEAPAAPTPDAGITPRQQYEALRSSNPRMAAAFYQLNAVSIDKDW